MRLALVIGWVGLLGFVTWEFVMAASLPEKYANLSPNVFRVADVLIGLLAVLSLIYLLRQPS